MKEIMEKLNALCSELADSGYVDEAGYLRGAADGAIGDGYDESYLGSPITTADKAYHAAYYAARNCEYI